jgi:hypothetical protein
MHIFLRGCKKAGEAIIPLLGNPYSQGISRLPPPQALFTSLYAYIAKGMQKYDAPFHACI